MSSGGNSVISILLASPLILLGVILALGALLGDAAERAKLPWISGCIVVGVVLGPEATDVLQGPKLAVLDGFTQASLAVIAFQHRQPVGPHASEGDRP